MITERRPAESGAVDLRLADGTELRLHEPEIARADLRLAYVQHPFPAQGHTTDTAHLIVTANATREGSYVALTRARDETHIYAADTPDRPAELDRLQDLADRISRTEPELPSIHTPLAHERAVVATLDTSEHERRHDRPQPPPAGLAEIERRARSWPPTAEMSPTANTDVGARNDNDDQAGGLRLSSR